MKPIFLIALFLLLPSAEFSANAPQEKNCLLNVHATGFRNEKGAADAAIFSSPDGWPEGHNNFARGASAISRGQSTISFHLPPGKYSVVVLHDENDNHKMDRNVLGVPEEGFGFSNNPHVFLKAPSFLQASIEVACPATDINVKMIYK